ncbi:Diaminopimelate decarboxylase [Sphingomonas antarctica]|uniref:pyridoxal-dependent decarboxylase, exosortase A system-associated n=1 Tax=Sphingomonas antarctica TaxID=2040274 RepID=UPI0039EB6E81
MKPYGPIPDWWTAERLAALLPMADAGTPLFVYDLGQVETKIAYLRNSLPGIVSIHYAMKANPFAPLLSAMVGQVDGVDVASGGELAAAIAAGATHISFAGPGKTDAELEQAIIAGVTLNLESEGEAGRALHIAARLGVTPKLAVRVNPPFALKGSGMKMGGAASPFGVDADRAAALVRRLIDAGADWRGLHIFAGSQSLDGDAVAEAQAATVTLAAEIAEAVGVTPPLVNLGGGFGIPYFAGDRALDVAAIGARLGETLANRPAILRETRFALELGRWLVGEVGIYFTRVIDRKESRGETFLVVDGGLHHQLAASGNFGTVVRRNYPVAVVGGEGALETVSVVGALCTPLDRLADQVQLPRADVGDVIAIFMAGAYGATASPTAFLGHTPAREILIGQ